MVGSRLLKINKKWRDLKLSQRGWIYDVTKEEVAAYFAEYEHLPGKRGRRNILNKIHDIILARGIWLPYGEIKLYVCKFIGRVVRKHAKQDINEESANIQDVVIEDPTEG